MRQPRLEDSARVVVKHLDTTGVVTGNDDFSISSNLSASCYVAESRNRLDKLAGLARVDLHAGACSDGKGVAVARDVRDRIRRRRRH